MHLTRRTLLTTLLASAVAGAFGTTAVAAEETYPSKPIKLVVPWSPGGATDVLGRMIAKGLTERIGQTVVVENQAGAGGNIGTTSFVRQKPDGYTLLVATSSTNAANPHLYKQLGFDPANDFAPIAFVAKIPNVLEVPKDSKFKSYKELIDYAAAHPGELNYGSAGTGSSQHLAASLLKHLTGTDIVHIPFKGSGPAASALMGGEQLDFMIDTGSVNQVKAGSLRALAVASEERTAALPDVPTFGELGLPDMIAFAWYGIVAPAGTPDQIVTYLNKEINAVVQSPEVKQHLENMGAQVPPPEDAASFANFMNSELTRYGDLIKMSGAKME
ncbi:tripartite tricarboxylate transporter substrate binding protein [Pusillimonas sp. MFBS29]|uniref:Bug family tripartite tricarboxylate transporter substrate binding protein n=1 Tax=Pusillimonas sp. MFBS29 TaxID=2886690 RepID=UPI001D1050A1|nr:tripartite tricarboxylate transporter substrate binding protein [Pusillimonas sp. MFBS29]MCC2595361.1 tripartite tricarboxylate transporter substrate binding protein [Pusillimonas sp. MFBS29]